MALLQTSITRQTDIDTKQASTYMKARVGTTVVPTFGFYQQINQTFWLSALILADLIITRTTTNVIATFTPANYIITAPAKESIAALFAVYRIVATLT